MIKKEIAHNLIFACLDGKKKIAYEMNTKRTIPKKNVSNCTLSCNSSKKYGHLS